MTQQTFVSGVFHLSPRDGTTRRSPEFLLEHGAYVLSLPAPLVLFVDPEFVKPCLEARRDLGLEELTRVFERPLEQFELAALIPLVQRFEVPENCDGLNKETPWHQLIQWSKLDLICEVVDSNPFGTEHFAWIDFSVAHVAALPKAVPAPCDRLALLELMPTTLEEANSRTEFYQFNRFRTAGGLIRGRKDTLREFQKLFEGELAAALSLRLRPNEEMIYAALGARHRELFEPYYGDYSSVLSNWDLPRRDFDRVIANAAFCRTNKLWQKGLKVCLAVEVSLDAGQLILNEEQVARWLDEFFVHAWYGGVRERCPEFGQRLQQLDHTDYVQEHSERLSGNLALLGLKFEPTL